MIYVILMLRVGILEKENQIKYNDDKGWQKDGQQ